MSQEFHCSECPCVMMYMCQQNTFKVNTWLWLFKLYRCVGSSWCCCCKQVLSTLLMPLGRQEFVDDQLLPMININIQFHKCNSIYGKPQIQQSHATHGAPLAWLIAWLTTVTGKGMRPLCTTQHCGPVNPGTYQSIRPIVQWPTRKLPVLPIACPCQGAMCRQSYLKLYLPFSRLR